MSEAMSKDQDSYLSTGTIGRQSTPIFGLTRWIRDISQSFVNGAENLEKRKKAESFRGKKAGSRDLTSGREHAHVVTKLRYPIPSCHLKLWIEE
ncbi:unnamed protein product [Fusarium graminearum]|uniref:Chromosome 1, complete genome n=1 Tax=Gibberella zeae (strain ATCC MYA-4620 / CBS 123657 / FGSC 9075 / NRRL 31084 / PH-1) TaxID=229533 RepID=I1S5D5_GIBZE|nr:hypothetical protein FGSG_12053 [Fusarium graminearum PH-1]ESU07383.1 hypothetical protein FGSG_12053 [Fusarium graminearum PH-1]CEF74223.1 unnamed protein product [Fusarium graminearum]CZS77490.1 unnamed protein product [Fusarium graminearum]|eukprot:XP_011317868.1 hypothetical protein FGSG_12053 [Fusarium graminearum PH-1]